MDITLNPGAAQHKKLYLIERLADTEFKDVLSAVVCAYNENEAKGCDPSEWSNKESGVKCDQWVHPDSVNVVFLGWADESISIGTVHTQHDYIV